MGPDRNCISRRDFLKQISAAAVALSLPRCADATGRPAAPGPGLGKEEDILTRSNGGAAMGFDTYQPSYLIPTPKEMSLSGQVVTLDSSWGIEDRTAHPGLAGRYAEMLNLRQSRHRTNLALVQDGGLEREEYQLEISGNAVTIRASSENGFLHALATIRQLRNGPVLPVGRIRDYPRLEMRGFHLMFESIHQIGAAEAVALISSAAKLKLNTILFEFGPRFPFERHAAIRSPSALTRSELRQIVAHARSLGITCIPLLQSLGHLNYLLRHDEYADIREEDEHRDQLCPTNERSFQIFTELAEEVLSFFPDTRFMHIGADETRRLGVCPRCRRQAEESGTGSLYITHTNKVCSWLSNRGITPILWDDVLCARPRILDELCDDAWIMYWDYWTTESPSPLVVARYNPEGRPGLVVYDERWQGEWKAELSDVTARTLAVFAQPVDLTKRLGGEFSQVFGPYLGDQQPEFVRAFPYLEYYQAHGHPVIGAPAGASNTSEWLCLPDFPRYGHNIKAFAERCAETSGKGIITTAWFNFPPEAFYFSLVATAQHTW